MITACFTVDERESLCGFSITGHADTGARGADPLCAAVSGMATLVANTLTEVKHLSVELAAGKKGALSLRVPADRRGEAQDVLLGFLVQLRDYEAQYPENIRVTTKCERE